MSAFTEAKPEDIQNFIRTIKEVSSKAPRPDRPLSRSDLLQQAEKHYAYGKGKSSVHNDTYTFA